MREKSFMEKTFVDYSIVRLSSIICRGIIRCPVQMFV